MALRLAADQRWRAQVGPPIPAFNHHDDGDDPVFVDWVLGLTNGLMLLTAPHDTFVHKVDNWFGRRWLGFSHKVMGIAGAHYDVRASRRKRRLTSRVVVPPFHPRRVVWGGVRRRRDLPERSIEAQHRWQWSEENLRIRLERQHVPDGVVELDTSPIWRLVTCLGMGTDDAHELQRAGAEGW